MQHSDRITHVHRSTNHSVDAHVAHRTYHHDLIDIEGIKVLLEIGFPEGVDVFLGNHKLVAFRGYCLLNLRAAGSFDEYWGIGIFGFVPYVKNGNAGITRMTYHTASIRYSVFNAAQR